MKRREFKDNQYWRSKLIKAGVSKKSWSHDKNYWQLIMALKDEHIDNYYPWDGVHFNLDELHNAILSLRR